MTTKYPLGFSTIGTTPWSSAGLDWIVGINGLQRCIGASRAVIRFNLDPLDTTAAFPYLGCAITFNNIKWVDLYCTLRKAQQWWGILEELLVTEVMNVLAWEIVYKTVVHMVMIYGSKNWVVTDELLKILRGSTIEFLRL